MHDAIQWGTLILVGFGILLNRYDYNALRKEMRSELSDLRKEMDGKFESLRKEMEGIRVQMSRNTETIMGFLFKHEECLTRVETKLSDK